MIDRIDQKLKHWAEGILDAPTVFFDLPAKDVQAHGVCIYLIELLHNRPERTLKRPPLQFTLRYMVTTWDALPEVAHRMLGELLFSAMQHADMEVDQAAVTYAAWQAMGIRPRPAFFIRIPLRKEIPEPRVPRVARPINIETLPQASLHGKVLGPGNQPIAGARVVMRAINRTVYTDSRGCFILAGVPAGPVPLALDVNAKGWQTSVTVTQTTSHQQPFVIHMQEMEV